VIVTAAKRYCGGNSFWCSSMEGKKTDGSLSGLLVSVLVVLVVATVLVLVCPLPLSFVGCTPALEYSADHDPSLATTCFSLQVSNHEVLYR